jgi:hypothetical protein
MGAIGWAVGFGVFVVVAVGAQYGIEVALDAYWGSQGLDPASRPHWNPVQAWALSGAIGLAAGWLVGRAFGDD